MSNKDEIEYLKAIEEFLLHQWECTQDPETRAALEAIDEEIRAHPELIQSEPL